MDPAGLEVSDDHCKMQVLFVDAPHVIEESAELAERFPHRDAAQIASCSKRLELYCPMESVRESTNLLAFIEQASAEVSSKCWLFDPMAGRWI